MIDSHCHLDMFDDLEGVMARAQAAGVRQIVTISTKVDDGPKLAEICQHYPQVVVMTTGVHPEETEELTDEALEEALRLTASSPFCVGVGEIGLDYHQKPAAATKARQQHFFDLQMSLARELGLPVSIHTREAISDTLAVVGNHSSVDGVFHCFSENVDIARQVLDLGYRISLSGIVTFKKATAMQEVARFVPLDRLLIETDAPFLAPEPHRGQRNEPAFVAHTGAFIAQLRGLDPEALFEQTERNTKDLFRLKDRYLRNLIDPEP